MAEAAEGPARVLVVGVGSIGGVVLGGLLQQDPAVLSEVVGLSSNADVRAAVAAGGLRVRSSLGEHGGPARVVAELPADEPPFDYVLLATQPPQVEAATREALPWLAPDGRMVVLQNGLCEERVAALLGPERVVGAVVTWGASHPAPGVYARTSAGGFVVGRLSGELDAAARRRRRRTPGIVAKIERPVALGDLDGIAAEADAMMVARGDLAIELDFARVPVEQRRIQAACDRAAIPCIVATQMLQSMMEAPLPTRAEASDVANAILGGTDAVMLSGETAAGRHPFESVRAMRRIAQEAERWTAAQPPAPLRAIALAESPEPAAVLARAIAQMAVDARARAVLCWTDARSVRFISQADVQVPIVAFGDDDAELRSLALLRGVHAIRTRRPVDSRDFVRRAEALLRSAGTLATDDRVVVATGFAGHGTERLWLRRVGERAI
jgi:hypothetical protein